MAKLQWDKAGQRLFEAGVDRGVLYLADNSGVAWNGLTALDENFSEDSVEPVYFDGVKINDVINSGDFAADLSAYTYPDEFDPYQGVVALGDGLYVDGQENRMFGMSFRTLVGNDLEFMDLGYRLHILYNLTAVPGGLERATISDTVDPLVFQWGLTTVPVKVDGYHPTAHIYFDSRFIPADILAAVEDILYGTSAPGSADYNGGDWWGGQTLEIDGGGPGDDGEELPEVGTVETQARLPSIQELLDLVTLWAPKTIVPHFDTGIADLETNPRLAKRRVFGAQSQADPPALGEFDRVAKQVQQDLFESLSVADDPIRGAPVQLELQRQTFPFGVGTKQGDDRCRQRVKRHRRMS